MNEQAMMMNQQQQQHQQLMNMNSNLTSLNQMNPQQLQQSQPQMLPINRRYGVWLPHMQPQPPFKKPNPSVGGVNPPPSTFKNPFGPRTSWKGKRIIKPNDKRRKDQHKSLMVGNSGGLSGGVNNIGGDDGKLNFSNYNLPTLNELQYQNRLKTGEFFPIKKFNQNNNINMKMCYNNNNNFNNSRSAPFAPRNTTSFLIRAKKWWYSVFGFSVSRHSRSITNSYFFSFP